MNWLVVGIILVIVLVLGLALLYFLPGITAASSAMRTMTGPVRGEWRGLPLPVAEDEVFELTDAPITPPPPTGTHVAVITASGMQSSLLARWFLTNLTRRNFALDNAMTTDEPDLCVRTFRSPEGGIVQIVIKQESTPYQRTNVFIFDARDISSEVFIAATQPLVRIPTRPKRNADPERVGSGVAVGNGMTRRGN